MNAEIEREIVQNFVQKRSKERLRWELSSPKKDWVACLKSIRESIWMKEKSIKFHIGV